MDGWTDTDGETQITITAFSQKWRLLKKFEKLSHLHPWNPL